ncbi:hypothetical protein QYF36_007441 [Acer negundo]|nr:hypothetical protein QYF36_007441 [Acer negundo]
MAAVTAAYTLVKIYADFQRSVNPSQRKKKKMPKKKAVEMEHEDTGQRHEEEKEYAYKPAIEMEHEDAVEKKRNVEEEENDPKEA